MDGQQQRRALTAAERAVRSLAAAEAEAARAAADQAAQLDQIGVFADLPAAVAAAAESLQSAGLVPPADWDTIAAAVGPGPLAALVAQARI